jgi:hypothetical protein
MRVASSRWAQELQTSFRQASVETPSQRARAAGSAADRKARVTYDHDILHIIEQYPGCTDVRVLAFLRARVHWFGRGTLIDKFFRPSLATVHAAARRLERAGSIKTKADGSPHQAFRLYPNNPLWI